MKIIKQILWSILAFFVFAIIQVTITIFGHPVGGGEFHQIFAYSGGRLDIALWVFVEYVITAWSVAFILIFFRYPAHWSIVASIACFFAWARWLRVCFFPYQAPGFHEVVKPLLFAIPPIVASSVFLAQYLSRRFFGLLRQKELSWQNIWKKLQEWF